MIAIRLIRFIQIIGALVSVSLVLLWLVFYSPFSSYILSTLGYGIDEENFNALNVQSEISDMISQSKSDSSSIDRDDFLIDDKDNLFALSNWDAMGNVDMEADDIEYSGYNSNSDYFSVTSPKISKKGNFILMDKVKARMLHKDSIAISLDAPGGIYNLDRQILTVDNGAFIVTSHGVMIALQKVTLDLKNGKGYSKGNICINAFGGSLKSKEIIIDSSDIEYLKFPKPVRIDIKKGENPLNCAGVAWGE